MAHGTLAQRREPARVGPFWVAMVVWLGYPFWNPKKNYIGRSRYGALQKDLQEMLGSLSCKLGSPQRNRRSRVRQEPTLIKISCQSSEVPLP